jgi:DNA-binding NarL/FixJ family response regulator
MKVLIADDHPMVRDAVARTVAALWPQAEVVEAPAWAEALAVVAAGAVDIVLLDLHMPAAAEASPANGATIGAGGVAGVAALRRLHGSDRRAKIVVVSGADDPALMRDCLAAGAMAFVPKSEPPTSLPAALAAVHGGASWLPARLVPVLASLRAAPPGDPAALTPRQRDVLRLLMRGEPNKLIARELGLTEGTVKIHIAAILRALGVRNRTEAVVVARRLGIDG